MDRRALECWLVGLVALSFVAAAPGWAAQVMDVRVGKHREFTRVVFELDNAAGYRISRSDTEAGGAELIISLNARSGQRKVKVPRSLIKGVEIRPDGTTAVARVRLAKSGLRLKEMILANPPRIVLDFSTNAKPTAVAKAKPAPKAAPRPAPKVAVEKTAPKPEPKKMAAVVPKPVAPEPTREPELARTRVAVPEPEVPIPPPAEPVREPVEISEPSIPAPEPQARTSRRPAPGERTRSAEAKPPPRSTTRASAPASAAEEQPSMDYTMVALAAGGLVLLVGGVMFWRRRGKKEAPPMDESAAEGFDEENPFSAWAEGSDDAAADALPTQDTAIFEESGEEAKAEDMEQTEMPGANAMENLSGPPSVAGAGGSEEIMQLVRELERRVATVEAKLDESVEARERLERQVAAQTEELRVQRAAIARTQRAVRNLTRTEEELPTEPALRDPDRPSPD